MGSGTTLNPTCSDKTMQRNCINFNLDDFKSHLFG